MRAWIASVVVALVAAALVAPTAEAGIYEGDRVRGTQMDMWTDARGRVTRINIGWDARCRHGRADRPGDYTGGGGSELHPARRSSRRFSVASASRVRIREGHYLNVRIRMRGSRRQRKRWIGTYRVLVNVYRDGRHVDVCRTPRTVWEARRIPRWRLEVSGGPGDFITQGRPWMLGPPAHRAYAYGDRNMVGFSTRPWPDGLTFTSGEFAAPPGERLEVGRTYHGAWRVAEDRDGRPGMDVSGMGRGCNLVTGDFTIHAREFARPREVTPGLSRELRRLRVSFVQYCGSGAPARGAFDYSP
jgi:hypothetical protein